MSPTVGLVSIFPIPLTRSLSTARDHGSSRLTSWQYVPQYNASLQPLHQNRGFELSCPYIRHLYQLHPTIPFRCTRIRSILVSSISVCKGCFINSAKSVQISMALIVLVVRSSASIASRPWANTPALTRSTARSRWYASPPCISWNTLRRFSGHGSSVGRSTIEAHH
jgi:hypothetical protein